MDYYKVGTIVNTQGLQGEVRIISVTDFSEERYQKNAELALFDKADNFVRTLKIKTHRKQKNFDIVKFDGLYSINDVEKFRDFSLKVAAENRAELDSEDEFYYDDIIGLDVFEHGTKIGTVSEILQPGANDVWVIKRQGKKDLLLHFKELEEKKVDYFYLGCDFKNNSYDEQNINSGYKNIFNTKNVFITVSTIEPRKNHNYILEAFEKLWSKNIDVKYVIIGRIGWKVDDFISRVKNHKQYNKNLFIFNNIDDEHLLYAYKNSKALIFASYIEGFGLPIIESLHNKLQVLASDIGIHREIGRDFVSYFNLNDINSLAKLIEDDNFNKNIDDFKWISWEESAKDLIEKVLKAE